VAIKVDVNMEKITLKTRPFFLLTQETLAIALKASVILFATFAVFFQDLAIIFNDALRNETTSYILVIPFILTYLVYRKRKMIKAAISLESSKSFKIVSTSELVGALLLLASFLLYWYGSYTFSPLEYHLFSLPIFTSACTLILFGTQTLKQLIFPIVFLFLLVPPPVEILYNFGALFSTISSDLAYTLLNLLGFPASLSAEYGTPVIFITRQNGTTISFAVDIACSGIYSQIGFFVFAIFMVYLVRDKTWKKALIFLVGFPLIQLLNVLRIFSISIIGYYYGADLALTVFHLLGGWILIFLGTLLLLLTSEKLFKIRILENQTEKCSECNLTLAKNQNFCFACGRIHKTNFKRINKREMAKVAGLIISVILILSIQAPVFALTEGPAEIILQTPKGQQMTTEILPKIPEYTLRFMYRDLEFEKIAKQDASLMYAYFPNNDTKKVIWVSLEIASTKSSLHSWEYCLITYRLIHPLAGEPVKQIELKEVQLLENPPIKGRYFVYQKQSNETQAVLYWYETSTFETNSTSGQKHVKISVITYPYETESVQQTEDELLKFGKTIAGYWQPIKTWSHIALLISESGSYLLLIAAAALVVVIFFQIFKVIKTKRTNFKAFQKLSKEDRAIVEAIYQTKKMPTPSNIATTYEKLNHKSMPITELVGELQKAKDAGLVKQEILNAQDEPVVGWKTQLTPQIRREGR